MSALEQRVCYLSLVVVIHLGVGPAFGSVPPGRFADAKPVLSLDSPWADEQPALTPDELTIVFSSDRPAPGPRLDSNVDLYLATRETVGAPFGEPIKLNINVDNVADDAPWLSANGLSLYYSSGGDIFVSNRQSVQDDWQVPVNLDSVNSRAQDFGPFLSADELTIYFNSTRSGSNDLFVSTRSSKAEPFGPAEPLAGVNTPVKGEYGPSVSSDGLTLFYASNTLFAEYSQIWIAERASMDQSFANPVLLEEFSLGSARFGGEPRVNWSPFISSSWPSFGSRLYFASTNDLTRTDYDIWQATWFPGWDFADRNLEGVNFSNTNLENVDFTGSNLKDVSFSVATLAHADFSNAVVNGADFERTTPFGFTKEQFYSTASYQAKNLQGIRLGGNDLSDWSLAGQNLAGAYLGGATLAGADLSEADVTAADFEVTTRRGFTKEQLYSTASYKAKDLRGIRLGSNDLSDWNLAGQNLAGAYMGRSSLPNTDLSQANLANADFTSASLAGANLAGANVQNASFHRADLESAVLSPDTQYSQWTIFPAGFDPADHELKFVSSDAGDLDGSAGLTTADVDLLATRIRDDSFIAWQFSMFDLNGDSAISVEDLRFWVEDLMQTALGDADLNGRVDFPDFVALADNFGGPGGWGQGDFNADGQVQFPDFVILADNFGQGAPGTLKAAASAVPEPCSVVLGLIGCLFAFFETRIVRNF